MSKMFVIALDVSDGTAMGFLRSVQNNKKVKYQAEDGRSVVANVLYIYPTDKQGNCEEHTSSRKESG
jgi:hypothetical protein